MKHLSPTSSGMDGLWITLVIILHDERDFMEFLRYVHWQPEVLLYNFGE